MGFAVTTKAVAEEKKLAMLQYEPSQEDLDVLGRVIRDYTHAFNLQNQSWREFNDLSLLDRQSEDQKAFNAYLPPKDTSDDEYWKAQTIRPVTRNKVIAIAARITSVLIAPHVFAQNKDDEEDRDAARVMEDIMEWANDHSDYVEVFMNAVIAMLVNPAACVEVKYQEVKRTMKEVQANGTWKEKEVIDEEESGFKNFNVPIDEILLGNMYVQDIQKQPFVIRDRNIDYSAAKMLYGHLENFQYVKAGVKAVFCQETGSFYEEQDLSLHDRLVNEVTYWNRYEDVELKYINGIPITKPDQPLPRKDKKLPLIWGGYEPIDEGQFACFKSLVFKLAPEQEVIDEMYNMTLDGRFLEIMPPSAIYGEEMVDTSVIVPGGVTAFSDPNTKLEVFRPSGDSSRGFDAIERIEQSMAEGSSSSMSAGVAQTANRTAFEIATVEENARIQLGLFGKALSRFVKNWGELRVGDIVQHLSVADATKISTGDALSYKTLLVEKKDNKETTKIEFRSDLPEEPETEEENLIRELELLERSKRTGQKIFQVNPKLFRELKYKVRVASDVLFQPTGAIMRALNLEGYDRMVTNPLIAQDPESLTNVTRDMLVEQYKPGEADKYIPGPNKLMRMMQKMAAKQVPQGQQVQAQQAQAQPSGEMTEALTEPLGLQPEQLQPQAV